MKNINKKLVAIGGGTGLSVLLKGLKEYPLDLSAIVTMTDDGMSSGRLRKTFHILPPGDIRKIIVALSSREDIIKSLFEYRFKRGKGLSGHSLGNLLILALERITGSFPQAISQACQILASKGKVIPATWQNIGLIAQLQSGKKIIGERQAYNKGKKDPIINISLNQDSVQANQEAVSAIKSADVILIGPGSLWTSVIPNFLIKDILQAVLANKKAQKIYICNVSTERGETQNYSVPDHIRILTDHSQKNIFSHVLVNNRIIKTSQKTYKLGEINNITTAKNKIGPYKILKADIIDEDNPLYHHSKKLAQFLWEFINAKKRRVQ